MISAAPSTVWRKVRHPLAPLLLLLLIAGPLAVRAGNLDDLDRDHGLPDARLGAPLKSFTGLQLVEDSGRWLTYKIPGEKLKYAGNEVTSIKYNFFKDQLYSIDVTFDNKTTCKRLLKMLEQNYGTVHSFETRKLAEADTELETREWTASKTYLVFKNAADHRGGTVIFVDKPMWDALAKPREERSAQLRKMLDGSYTNGDF